MGKPKFWGWLQSWPQKIGLRSSSRHQLSPLLEHMYRRYRQDTDRPEQLPLQLERQYQRYRQSAGRSAASLRSILQPQDLQGELLYALTVKYLDAESGKELYLPHRGYYRAGQQVVLLAPYGTMPGVSPEYDVLRIKMADRNLTIELKYHASDFDPAQKIKEELKVLSCPEQQTLADYLPYM